MTLSDESLQELTVALRDENNPVLMRRGLQADLCDELLRLRAENARLRKELDIANKWIEVTTGGMK